MDFQSFKCLVASLVFWMAIQISICRFGQRQSVSKIANCDNSYIRQVSLHDVTSQFGSSVNHHHHSKMLEPKRAKNIECCICLAGVADSNNNRKFLITPCKHSFHKKCLLEWINTSKNECPICRMNFDKVVI